MATIDSVEGFLTEVKNVYSNWNSPKHLFFRGHSDRSNFRLKPSVFRNGIYSEKDVLLDFKQYAPAHDIKYDFYLERDRMLADMQHQGIPTRLLDWTVAPLNALYFACSKDEDKDGEVIAFHPWKYWAEIVRDKNQEEIHQIHILSRALLSGNWSFAKIKEYIHLHFGYAELTPEDLVKPFAFVATYTNQRILHQRGCFTIHGTDKSELDDVPEFKRYSTRMHINAASKATILKDLNRLYINDYSIYPDFDGMKKMIERHGSLFSINGI